MPPSVNKLRFRQLVGLLHGIEREAVVPSGGRRGERGRMGEEGGGVFRAFWGLRVAAGRGEEESPMRCEISLAFWVELWHISASLPPEHA